MLFLFILKLRLILPGTGFNRWRFVVLSNLLKLFATGLEHDSLNSVRGSMSEHQEVQ